MLRRALQSITSRVAAGVDQALYNTALSPRSRPPQQAVTDAEIEQRIATLRAITEEYGQQGYIDDPASFFPAAHGGEGRATKVRSPDLGVDVLDLRWQSRFTTLGRGVAARYQEHSENDVAVARVIVRRHEQRPAVVLIHGYLGGELAVEERLLPAEWFLEQGYDVALLVLPFHGERKHSKTAKPVFPSSDPRFTIEGFRQAVGDFRWLMRWLKARGAPSVGVLGMSLGGYTTSLLSTVEPGLSFAVPLVPLASLADFAREGGRLVGSPEQQERQYQALEEAFRVVSPLGRPAALAGDRMLVVAGEVDRITPVSHARKLAEHLGAPLEIFHGGHLLQLGRDRAFEPLARLLNRIERA